MKSGYQTIVYIIAATILATIGIQIYFNIIHYNANKAELINQVQASLDKALEAYYADIAVSQEFKFETADSIPVRRKVIRHISSNNTIMMETIEEDTLDSNINIIVKDGSGTHDFSSIDSTIQLHRITDLATKIFVSISSDTLELRSLQKILTEDFESKNWPIHFGLISHDFNCIDESSMLPYDTIRSLGLANVSAKHLTATSKSPFLPRENTLEIRFSNISKILLQRSLVGMILSLILSIAIVASLVFLLRIINKQKQLAEIKNDLISNITHEFKTPITTISTALQAIESFNNQDDKDKTKKYLAMSNQQVEKLNVMVEKLLETATLDSDQLQIEKEPTDLVHLIDQICEKHAMIAENKTIETKLDDVGLVMVDPFHFENAVANIIDNAIKYGGDLVHVSLSKTNSGFEITVKDNGDGINKQQQALVFEKFYRIPKGNIHDVKGFGIGLYYSQKIIDKHGGELSLSSQPGNMVFKITMA